MNESPPNFFLPAVRSPGCGQKHLLVVEVPLSAALFMLMTRPSTSHTHLPLEYNKSESLLPGISVSGTLFFFHCSHITVDMIWRHLMLLGVSVVLLMRVECRIKEGKTLTFRRTQHSESQDQMRRRPRRDASSSPGLSKPSHGPPFTSCRLLLTPAEHEVLDDNTHEVSCSLVNIGRCNVRRAFYLM